MAGDTAAAQARLPDHELGWYASEGELADLTVPFCEAGVRAGERVVVRLDEPKAELIRSRLAEPDAVEYLCQGEQYADPATALQATLDLLAPHRAEDAAPLRLLGELPTLSGLAADGWLRYEAAVNQALAGLPVQTLCVCDDRSAPAAVRAELLRTHPVVAAADGRHRNRRYRPPDVCVADRSPSFHDPLEAEPPALELCDPSPSAARHAIADLADEVQLDAEVAQDLLMATNETVTNALVHGQNPTSLRGWGREGRVLVAVGDAGQGPQDPFVGLLPLRSDAEDGGQGLWLVQQLCPEVAFSNTSEGFTVRLAAGSRRD